VAADKIAHIPKRLDLEQGGAIATTGLTALQGIHDALYVKKGETVLIHGASGGSEPSPSNLQNCAAPM